jgi:glycosyltransferase involved in cell wall biosynthesis
LKILHISTSDKGGAGLCCIRIHKGLLQSGMKSKVLVLNKHSDEPEVIKFIVPRSNTLKLLRWSLNLLKLILFKLKIPTSKRQKYQFRLDSLRRQNGSVFFTLPFSENRLHNHELIKEADIIHLHWVAGFIDYPEFFKSINKPVVWTPHDENIILGGFHYKSARDKYMSSFGKLEMEIASLKQRILAAYSKLSVVALSEDLKEKFQRQDFLKNKKVYKINNSVDTTIFKPFPKEIAKELFNLPQNKRIILFISEDLQDERKGFEILLNSMEHFNSNELAVFAVGGNLPKLKIPENIYTSGLIQDQRLLSIAYSAADIFVIPSLQEAFAQTPLEAMACGLPAVAFPFSGTNELINPNNGIRCEDFTVESLTFSLKTALDTEFDPAIIRNDIIGRFCPDKISRNYLSVYNEVINA